MSYSSKKFTEWRMSKHKDYGWRDVIVEEIPWHKILRDMERDMKSAKRKSKRPKRLLSR